MPHPMEHARNSAKQFGGRPEDYLAIHRWFDDDAVPVRYLGEQHVKEDLGRIPTAQDWLSQIRPERWMDGQRLGR